MAAIDPTAAPDYDDVEDKKTPRATLKIVRVPSALLDEDSEDEDDEENLANGIDDEDEESTDEEENGGPSDPEKAKRARKLDLIKVIAEVKEDANSEDEDEDVSDEEAAGKKALRMLKGKGKASDEEDDEEASIDLDDVDDLEAEEFVVCTLDPQQVILVSPTRRKWVHR